MKGRSTFPARNALRSACLGALSLALAPHCFAAAAPSTPNADGTPSGVEGRPLPGQGDLPVSGGNYDYFAALGTPGLGKYLEILTNRHQGQLVWSRFWSGNYKEPLGDCQYTLERFPNHPRALHLLAEIAKATNDVSMAIPHFEYALKLYPQYAFTHAQYGHYLLDIGAVQAGVGELREALRIEPKQFQAKAWLAEALAAHPELAPEPPVAGSATGGSAPKSGSREGKQ